jgi:hypothetical protein
MRLLCRGRRYLCRQQRVGSPNLVALVALILYPPEEVAGVGRCGARSTTIFFMVLVNVAQQRTPLQYCNAVARAQQ